VAIRSDALRLGRLREEIERLGWPGVVGLGLLAFAAAIALSALLPLREEVARLRDEVDALQRRLGGSDRAAARPPVQDQLATFYAFFPPPDSTPDWLGRIHSIAQAKGVQLQSGEYRFERAASPRLARYQITLPVQGTYAQIRGFVGEVLEKVPAAALEEVTLKRENVESSRVEARVRLTLFMGSA
jgi:Tfp pilus assembly protein PilO